MKTSNVLSTTGVKINYFLSYKFQLSTLWYRPAGASNFKFRIQICGHTNACSNALEALQESLTFEIKYKQVLLSWAMSFKKQEDKQPTILSTAAVERQYKCCIMASRIACCMSLMHSQVTCPEGSCCNVFHCLLERPQMKHYRGPLMWHHNVAARCCISKWAMSS